MKEFHNHDTWHKPQNTHKMKTLKVGDEVHYRGGFGTEEPQTVTINAIIVCPNEYIKDGEEVTEIEVEKIHDKNMIYDLSNQRWCRGNQIDMWREVGGEWHDENGII